MFRRVSFALIALALASTACPCHATAVIFSAQIGTLNTDYQGESIVWLGGLLAGSLNIMDTPYLINTNSVTGEVVGRYKFIGQMLFDGTPIDYRDSYVAVFDNATPSTPDAIGFRLYFEPFQIASNLALVAMNMDVQLSEVSDLGDFGKLSGLSSLPDGSTDVNLLLLPSKAVTFAYSSPNFLLSTVPVNNISEPSTAWLVVAAGLATLTFAYRRRNAV